MCGIAGLFRPAGLPREAGATAAHMTRLLAHRGPDDEGVEALSGPQGTWAVTGARRLAILDLEQGHQPMTDASGRVMVALNGEIYNHRRLRQELSGAGIPFRGHSDTEVVANLVATCGLRPALERLRGMFAVAVLDRADQSLSLARDRMGQKPLYYATLSDGTVAWGSELRALMAVPGIGRKPDVAALRALLLWEYLPTPHTPWLGIHKLEAGTSRIFSGGEPRVDRFWTPPLPQPGQGGSRKRWARSLRGALEVAVQQRLVEADVEVGVLLSGGLDSTTVAALAQARRSRPLRSFSIAVGAEGFDEGPWARKAAAAIGTEHRQARLESGDLPRLLDAISAHMDEPLADSSLVATWRLMELVQEAGITCVLSGDGADESFGGYPTLMAHRLAGPLGPFAPALARIAGRLPTRHGGVTRDYMARRFVDGLGHPWAHRHQRWMGAWLPEELLPDPEADATLWAGVDAHAQACAGTDVASRALYLDQRLYLGDGVLVKVDRASMAHGVEVRSPFLDHHIVELAADIPIGHKLRRGLGKAILRDAVADVVPAEILNRPKKGFGTPVGPWLRGPCQHLLKALPEALADLVPPLRLRQVMAEHQDGRADHRRRLWSALVLARWRERHG